MSSIGVKRTSLFLTTTRMTHRDMRGPGFLQRKKPLFVFHLDRDIVSSIAWA
jgi:hypothetical protein